MYTEDEARKKWCPFARAAFGWVERDEEYSGVSGAVSATVNRGTGISDSCRCIASECMAWQFERPSEFFTVPDFAEPLNASKVGPDPHRPGMIVWKRLHDTEPLGDCGLKQMRD